MQRAQQPRLDGQVHHPQDADARGQPLDRDLGSFAAVRGAVLADVHLGEGARTDLADELEAREGDEAVVAAAAAALDAARRAAVSADYVLERGSVVRVETHGLPEQVLVGVGALLVGDEKGVDRGLRRRRRSRRGQRRRRRSVWYRCRRRRCRLSSMRSFAGHRFRVVSSRQRRALSVGFLYILSLARERKSAVRTSGGAKEEMRERISVQSESASRKKNVFLFFFPPPIFIFFHSLLFRRLVSFVLLYSSLVGSFNGTLLF